MVLLGSLHNEWKQKNIDGRKHRVLSFTKEMYGVKYQIL